MARSIRWTIVAVAAVAAISDASATALSTSKTVGSGMKAGLLFFFNCNTHVPPGVQVGTPMHGTAAVVVTTGNYCRHSDEPVAEVFYQSNPGFTGKDGVAIYGPNGEAYVDLTVK